ncbi:MAG: hypothetical protein ACKVTZ_10995, partial [Bacteroidia bacterium]
MREFRLFLIIIAICLGCHWQPKQPLRISRSPQVPIYDSLKTFTFQCLQGCDTTQYSSVCCEFFLKNGNHVFKGRRKWGNDREYYRRERNLKNYLMYGWEYDAKGRLTFAGCS